MAYEKKFEDSIKNLEVTLEKLAKVEDKKESKAGSHRLINSVFMIMVLIVAYLGYTKVPDYIEESDYQTEISQIVNDEGLRLEVYRDSLGNATVGFGHLVKPGERFDKITPHEAIELLRRDYQTAKVSVERSYPWASGDVKLVLINMTYQMGPTGVAKFEKTLMALQMENYDKAASELLDSTWARQTPSRARRLAGRILELNTDFW